jgi:hypothetical protein
VLRLFVRNPFQVNLPRADAIMANNRLEVAMNNMAKLRFELSVPISRLGSSRVEGRVLLSTDWLTVYCGRQVSPVWRLADFPACPTDRLEASVDAAALPVIDGVCSNDAFRLARDPPGALVAAC